MIVPIDISVAVDPVKYIGVPSSFNDFKPDGDIVDDDRVPGKPSPPVHSVLGPYSHVMPLSLLHGCSRRFPPGIIASTASRRHEG